MGGQRLFPGRDRKHTRRGGVGDSTRDPRIPPAPDPAAGASSRQPRSHLQSLSAAARASPGATRLFQPSVRNFIYSLAPGRGGDARRAAQLARCSCLLRLRVGARRGQVRRCRQRLGKFGRGNWDGRGRRKLSGRRGTPVRADAQVPPSGAERQRLREHPGRGARGSFGAGRALSSGSRR